MSQYYVRRGDQQFGPYAADQIKELQRSGRLQPNDYVRQENGFGWTPAGQVAGLFQSAPPVADPLEEVEALVSQNAGYHESAYGRPGQFASSTAVGRPTQRYRTLKLLAGIYKVTALVTIGLLWVMWLVSVIWAFAFAGPVAGAIIAVLYALVVALMSFLTYLVHFSIAELILLATHVADDARTGTLLLEQMLAELRAKRAGP